MEYYENRKKNDKKYIIAIIVQIFSVIIIYKTMKNTKNELLNNINNNSNKYIVSDEFTINGFIPQKYNQDSLEKFRSIFDERKNPNVGMSKGEQQFLHGMISIIKPKKILELGVFYGTSSVVILNAIRDRPEAMLYSIEINNASYIGTQVDELVPELKDRRKLYKGATPAKFMEEIGPDIDFVLLDTSHILPGEMLNFLEVLPFLKENAVVIVDDLEFHKNFYKRFPEVTNWLFTYLKGKKILPLTNYVNPTFINSGAVILDSNQKEKYFDYFYALHCNWGYIPRDHELIEIRKLFNKYYDKKYIQIFEGALNFNIDFVNNAGEINLPPSDYPNTKRIRMPRMQAYLNNITKNIYKYYTDK